MYNIRPTWSRIGGILVSVVLATSQVAPTLAYAASSVDKAETVHVQTDATGEVSSIRVEELLSNDSATAQLSDLSILSGIVAEDENQSFTQGADNTITWTANGNEVAYEGTTDERPPVSVRLTYSLDGTQMQPSQLAGKSGHLKVRIDYVNESKTSEGGVSTPFVCMTVAMLDSEVFSNVTVENGKVVDDKGGIAVIGYALPGLKDSLDLNIEDLDLDFPEFIEIEADVTDLAMDPVYTIVTPELFSDIDTDDLDLGFDDLDEGTSALEEAMGQLIDGSDALSEALRQAADATKPLGSRIGELKRKLGVTTVGGKAQSTVVNDLVSQFGQLGTVADQVAQGTAALPEMANGASGAIAGAQSAVDAASDKVASASSDVSALKDKLGDEGLSKSLGDASSTMGEAAQVIRDADASLSSGVEVTGTEAVGGDIDAAIAAVNGIEGLTDEQKKSVLDQLEAAKTDLGSVSASVPQDLAEKADTLEEAAKKLDGQAGTLKSTAEDAKEAADSAAGSLAAASESLAGASTSLSGAASAIAPVAQVSGATNVGAQAISNALSKASDGLDEAVQQLPELLVGLDALAELPNGLSQLAEGSEMLGEGLSTFNDEGISTLVDSLNDLNDDFGNTTDRVEKLRDAAAGYDNFAGKTESQSGSVRFIYKTEAIG